MNKKKLLSVASSTLALVMLSACGSASSTAFSANWNPNPSANNSILPGTSETYTYSVYLKEDSATNTSYAVDYKNGTLTTNLSVDTDGNYVFTTDFSISVSFEYKGESTEYFNDTVTSTVTFKGANEGLKPISSSKSFNCHTPTSQNPVSLETTYAYYVYSVETTYTEDFKKGTSKITNGNVSETVHVTDSEKTFSVGNKNTYVDNEELWLAVRAIASKNAQTLSIYNSGIKAVQSVNFTKEKSESDSFKFTLNGTEGTRSIAYVPVSAKISGVNSGATQTFYVASDDNNNYRAMILKAESPISYSLGTLVYELTSATTFNG